MIYQTETCFFVGEHHVNDEIRQNLIAQLHRHIDALRTKGVDAFISCGESGFDLLAASVVLERKQQGENLRLIFMLPYRGIEQTLGGQNKKQLLKLLIGANEIKYVSDEIRLYRNGKHYEYVKTQAKYCLSWYSENSINKPAQMRDENHIQIEL